MTRAIRAILVALASMLPGQHAWADDLLRGQQLYDAWCLACHGPARAPLNATSLNARHSVSVLREGIANARSGMLFLGDQLSARDLSDIVAFLGTDVTTLDFGSVPADAGPAVRRVVLQAGREGFTGLEARVQGDFVRSGGTCGSAVASGTACTVEITFVPTGAGERQGVLLLSHSGLAGSARLPLTGVAAAPLDARPASLLALDATRVDFGTQTVGTPSAVRTVVATNRGDAPMAWLSRIPPVGFTVEDDCGTSLPPGGQCRLSLRFAPLSPGSVADDLVLVTSQAGGAVRLPLAGVGIAAAARLRWEPAPPLLAFPATPVGRSSIAPTALALRNEGPGPVRLDTLRVSGPQAGEFIAADPADASDCRDGRTLDAGMACRLSLVFTPRGTGERRATLAVASTGEAPAELGLAGVGVEPPPPAVATNLGGGGCTLGGPRRLFDPLWLLLTVAAVAVLAWRRRTGR